MSQIPVEYNKIEFWLIGKQLVNQKIITIICVIPQDSQRKWQIFEADKHNLIIFY